MAQPISSQNERGSETTAVHSVDDNFQEIVRRICAGSESAMEEFIQLYGAHMQRYVRKKLNEQLPLRVRFDSQDFVQMVWVSFFEDRETIAQFESPEQLMWYLVAMARNKLISELRHSEAGKGGDLRRTRSLNALQSQSVEPPAKDATPSHVAVAREQLQRLLDHSSDRDRRIVELRIAGKTYKEIGIELGIDERTARRAISRLLRLASD